MIMARPPASTLGEALDEKLIYNKLCKLCSCEWEQVGRVMHQSMLCPTLGRAGYTGNWPDFPASGSGILFYLTSRKLPRVGCFDILVTSLLSFSQARPTSWRVFQENRKVNS